MEKSSDLPMHTFIGSKLRLWVFYTAQVNVTDRTRADKLMMIAKARSSILNFVERLIMSHLIKATPRPPMNQWRMPKITRLMTSLHVGSPICLLRGSSITRDEPQMIVQANAPNIFGHSSIPNMMLYRVNDPVLKILLKRRILYESPARKLRKIIVSAVFLFKNVRSSGGWMTVWLIFVSPRWNVWVVFELTSKVWKTNGLSV